MNGWLRNLGSFSSINASPKYPGGPQPPPLGIGVYDYAGGGPVHIASGFSGLAYAVWIGKRHETSNLHTRPNNMAFVFLGTTLLWFGWLGFNGGSSIAPTTRGKIELHIK